MNTTTQISAAIDDAWHEIEALIENAPLTVEDFPALRDIDRKNLALILDRLACLANRVREELFDRKEVDEDTHTEEIEAVSAAADKVLGRETIDEDFDRYMLRRALRNLRAVSRKDSFPAAPLWTHD